MIPASDKAQTILLGQYFSPDETAQIVRPRQVMDGLLERVVMIRSYMIAIIAVVSLVTLLTMTLVIVLSIRLRRSTVEWDRDAEIRPFIRHFASPPVAGGGARGTFSDIKQRGLCRDGYACRCSWDSDLLALVVRVHRIL